MLRTKWLYGWIFVTISITFLLAFSVVLNQQLTDSFHEGEYLGNIWYILDYYKNAVAFPVLVHGPMDYLPQILAFTLFGQDHLIVYTRFFNTAAVFIGWAMYLDAGRIIIGRKGVIANGIFFFSFLWMAASSGNSPLGLQQAFIGTRDLFLIACVYAGIRAFADKTLTMSTNHYWLFVSSSAAAASLFWSYDRSLMALGFISSLSLSLIILRKWREVFMVAAGFLFTTLIISLLGVAGGITENIYNIYYWLSNAGEVWYMSDAMKAPAQPWAIGTAIFSMSVMLLALLRMVITRNNFRLLNYFVLSLFFVQGLFLYKLFILPAQNSFYFIWPSILILAYVLRGLDSVIIEKWRQQNRTQGNLLTIRHACYGTIIAALTAANFWLLFEVVKWPRLHQNIQQVSRPDKDVSLIDMSRFDIDKIGNIESECVFQFSNEGIYSLFLGRRFCTRFMYGVYIAKDFEQDVLSDFLRNPPKLVIFKSDYWYSAIYGRNMFDRLPSIHEFIVDNYTFSENKAGYIFATLK